MALAIPRDADEAVLRHRGRTLRVRALRKPCFPARGLTRGDLLRHDATVATVLPWEESAGGAEPGDFRLETVPARLRARGDLWKPLLEVRGRARLALAA